jgi:hypothetical protein
MLRSSILRHAAFNARSAAIKSSAHRVAGISLAKVSQEGIYLLAESDADAAEL